MEQKYKKISLIGLIFQAIITTCMFLPWIFIEVYYQNGFLTRTKDINLFNYICETPLGHILNFSTIAFMILSIVAFVLIYIDNKSNFRKYISFTPIISFILYGLTAFIKCECEIKMYSGPFRPTFHECQLNWLFFITIAMHITTVVFTIILNLDKIKAIKSNLKKR